MFMLGKKSLIADNLTKHASIDSLRKEMADLNSRAEMLLSNVRMLLYIDLIIQKQ